MTAIRIETTKTFNRRLLVEQVKAAFGERVGSIGDKPGVFIEIDILDTPTGEDTGTLQTIVNNHDYTQQSQSEIHAAQLSAVKTARATLQTFVDTPNVDVTTAQVIQAVKLLCRYVLYITRT